MFKFAIVLVALSVTALHAFKLISDKQLEEAEHWTAYDSVGRYLATQVDTKAEDFDWLPNSNKIGYGYNPIRGDPVCYTGDCHMSGYGRSLFQLDYVNAPKGSCTTKLIPQHVELDCIPSTEVREKTQKISSIKEFKESTASGMSWSVGFSLPWSSAGVANPLTSISFGYGQSQQTSFMMNNIYQEHSVVFHTYARVSTVKLSLFAPKLELSDNFRYVIDNLPATGIYTPAVERYIQDYLINYFGFTYTTELLLGGIAQMMTVIKNESMAPIQQEGESAEKMVGLSFGKAFSFNYNENESENSAKLQNFQRYVKSSLATTIGGDMYADKQKLTEWFQTVPKNPVIIKFTLGSIFDLITAARFPNDTNINEKITYVEKTLQQYLNKTSAVYCENQCTSSAHGTCQPLGAYGYGQCSCFHGFWSSDCSRIPTPPQTPPPTSSPTPLPQTPPPALPSLYAKGEINQALFSTPFSSTHARDVPSG